MAGFEKELALSAIETAASKLGFKLRPKQQEVILTFVCGRDVFVSMPTGSGKSLCYTLLPLVFDILKPGSRSIILVISPLLALMKDQVMALSRKNIKAVYIGGREDKEDAIVRRVYSGEFQVVFCSPESLLTRETWRDMLYTEEYMTNLVGFIVDEAHCVKKWGESFRREFSRLGDVRSLLPENVHVMALTATATSASRKAICYTLGMNSPVIIAQSPNKPNISYKVVARTDGETIEKVFTPLVAEIRAKRTKIDRLIIFGQSYDDCTSIFLYFKWSLGKELSEPPGLQQFARYRIVDLFTACTHPDVKNVILEQYKNPESSLRVIVATVAFGMGLDCPNVRQVIHWGVPSDIETYMQETGRAGRDSLPANATMYYGSRDMMGTRVKHQMREYCKLKSGCRRKFLLQHFDKDSDTEIMTKIISGCMCCDLCTK